MADVKEVAWEIKSQLDAHEALGTEKSYSAIVLRKALSVIEEQQAENKALRLLLDWAVECDFGYDQFFEEYEKYKHETEGLRYTEGMIKVARCVLAEKNS